MHEFRATDDGVNGASGNALRTADTLGFNDGDLQIRRMMSTATVKGFNRSPQQTRERRCTFITARRAMIYIGFTARERFRIGPARRIAALTALGLREQSVDSLYPRNRCWKVFGHNSAHGHAGLSALVDIQ